MDKKAEAILNLLSRGGCLPEVKIRKELGDPDTSKALRKLALPPSLSECVMQEWLIEDTVFMQVAGAWEGQKSRGRRTSPAICLHGICIYIKVGYLCVYFYSPSFSIVK